MMFYDLNKAIFLHYKVEIRRNDIDDEAGCYYDDGFSRYSEKKFILLEPGGLGTYWSVFFSDKFKIYPREPWE